MSIHDPRVLNFAILDILGTVLLAVITTSIHRYYSHSLTPLPILLLGHFCVWMLIAILVHYLLRIPTTLNYYLGLSEKPIRFSSSPRLFQLIKK